MNTITQPAGAKASGGRDNRLLASATSRRRERDKRWTEIAIYKATKSQYLVSVDRVAIDGCTIAAPHEEKQCRTTDDLRSVLPRGKNDNVSLAAYQALRAASEADASFALLAADLLPEDITERRGGTEAISGRLGGAQLQEHIVPRAGESDRPIRFTGRAIGFGSSRDRDEDDGRPWTEVRLFRLCDDRILGSLVVMPTLHVCQVAVATTGGEIVAELTGEGRGWVGSALVQALADARSRDLLLDEEIGQRSTVDWAHDIVGSTTVRAGDGRWLALSYMVEAGARIKAREGNSGEPQAVYIGGKKTTETPELTPRLFLALSRQRLICRDRSAIALREGESLWRVSPKGVQVLEWARSELKRPSLHRV